MQTFEMIHSFIAVAGILGLSTVFSPTGDCIATITPPIPTPIPVDFTSSKLEPAVEAITNIVKITSTKNQKIR